jgi:pyruvate/2-oxoacid:ferredoxin oxidoreductase alpha subunit
MIPRALAEKTKRMIEVNDDVATLQGVYFNPTFAQKLKEKVPELERAGIVISQTTVDSQVGQVIEAGVKASNGVYLDLGSVTLDGKNVTVKDNLATIDTLVSFVEKNSKQTAQ